MKNNCVNCHFFAEKILLKDNGIQTDPISRSLRKTIKESKIRPNRPSDGVMVCYKGVWDEGITAHKAFYNSCVNENRVNCFFYPYQNNMLFKAAEELQKREQDNKRIKAKQYLYSNRPLGCFRSFIFKRTSKLAKSCLISCSTRTKYSWLLLLRHLL